MEVLSAAAGQMMVLFVLIIAGYILAKSGAVPDNAALVLSRLENCVFVPALVMGTFIRSFTVEKIGSSGSLFLLGLGLTLAMMGISALIVRFFSRDAYIRRIYTYGFVFSNFGFMGNAIVSAVFPEIFMDYLVFTLPMWMLIYLWGVPCLLIPVRDDAHPVISRLKAFLNPMFIGLLLGMLIGILGISLPGFITKTLDAAGECMSPVAMLLTGITLAQVSLKKVLSVKSIYCVSLVRLVVFPLICIGVFMLLPVSQTMEVCTVCAMAMPLGLNTIVIPKAYGQDTSVAAGMTVVSHTLSVVTIPAVFYLMTQMI